MTVEDYHDHRFGGLLPDQMSEGKVPPGNPHLGLLSRPTHFIAQPVLQPLHFVSVIPSVNQQPASLRRRHVFTRETTDCLRKWLEEHLENPYPTDEEKAELASQTKLSRRQICYWFINARRRLVPQYKSMRKEKESATRSRALSEGDTRQASRDHARPSQPASSFPHATESNTAVSPDSYTELSSHMSSFPAQPPLLRSPQLLRQSLDNTPLARPRSMSDPSGSQQIRTQRPTPFSLPDCPKPFAEPDVPRKQNTYYHHSQIVQRRSSLDKQATQLVSAPVFPSQSQTAQYSGTVPSSPYSLACVFPQSQPAVMAQAGFLSSQSMNPNMHTILPYTDQVASTPLAWNAMTTMPSSHPVDMSCYAQQVQHPASVLHVPENKTVVQCVQPHVPSQHQPVLAFQSPTTMFHQNH